VSATESESIFNEKMPNDELFEVLNTTYKPSMFNDNQKLLLRFDDISLNIDIGMCETFDKLEYCFKAAVFWYVNHTLDQTYYKANIEVKQLIAKLELTRNIDVTEIKIGEEIKIITIIKNIGSDIAKNIEFKDAFTENISIKDITTCIKNNNNVTWEGTLEPLEEIQCDYTLKGIDKEDYTSIAKLTYFNGMKNITVQSDSARLKVEKHKIEVTANTINKYFDLNDTYDFKIVINNTDIEERFTVKVMVWFDEDIGIIQQSANIAKTKEPFDSLFQSTNTAYVKYYYKDVYVFDPIESNEYSFTINLKKKGQRTVYVIAEYNQGIIKNKINKTYNFQVERPEIIIPINATVVPVSNETMEPVNETNITVEESVVVEETSPAITKKEDERMTVAKLFSEHGTLIIVITLFILVDIAIGFSIYKKMRD
jgi:hypothetical protein